MHFSFLRGSESIFGIYCGFIKSPGERLYLCNVVQEGILIGYLIDKFIFYIVFNIVSMLYKDLNTIWSSFKLIYKAIKVIKSIVTHKVQKNVKCDKTTQMYQNREEIV